MKNFSNSLIIHGFAALHAAITILCLWAGADDSLILTMMTMLLTILLCLKRGLSLDLTAAGIIIVNVAGFLIGTYGAKFIGLFLPEGLVSRAISTFFTTELIGWTLVFTTRRLQNDDRPDWGSGMRWILAAYIVIFLFRFVYVGLFNRIFPTNEDFFLVFKEVFANVPALLIFLCINILCIRYNHRWKARRFSFVKTAALVGFIGTISVCHALAVGYGLPLHFSRSLTTEKFCAIVMIAIVLEISIYAIIYMIGSIARAIKSRDEARSKEHHAQYQYIKLKEQVNPHFLFNSLNILDCLVLEEKTRQASTYIHKLAGVYRYMINSEAETLVRLRDEITFVNMYADLLRVRFPEGFDIEYDLPDVVLGRWVAPCSLQLLIENAIKHNIVDTANPLMIRISATESEITVSNRLNPKPTPPQSTGLGLKYIKQVYKDLSGKEIQVRTIDGRYDVTLPLI